MPPPLAPFRTCVFRARPRGAVIPPLRPSTIAIRHVTEKNNPDKLPQAKEGESGPNTQQGEHVSEEAAKMAKMQGGEGPDMSVGTPVQEVSETALLHVMYVDQANNSTLPRYWRASQHSANKRHKWSRRRLRATQPAHHPPTPTPQAPVASPPSHADSCPNSNQCLLPLPISHPQCSPQLRQQSTTPKSPNT